MSHPGNDPEEYAGLTEKAQAALQVWIRLAIAPAPPRTRGWSSYFLKHEFEAVGFYITNGEFKGAMLAAGYAPKDEGDFPNWSYPVKARAVGNGRMKRPFLIVRGETFSLRHLSKEDRAAFDAFIRAVRHQERKQL